MRSRRILSFLSVPLLLTAFSGCGLVHFGRLPPTPESVVNDEKLLQENSNLKLEKKMLQQELVLTRAQGDALRMAVENRAADGDTSRRLVEKLNQTTRELGELRASYTRLQTERTPTVDATALQERLGATEERLAASLRAYTELQGEIARLRTEVDRSRTENIALTEKVKVVTAQNAQAQAALAQLNSQLLLQTDARARAEQDAVTLRTQLKAAPGATLLAQQRTGAAAEARSLNPGEAAEIAALRQELEEFRGKVGALESERAQLQRQIAAGGAPDGGLSTALQSNSALRQENEQLKTSAAKLALARTELETQLERLKSSPNVAQAQTLREQLRDAQAHATALTEENTKLKTRLATGRSGAVEPLRIELTPDPRPRASTPPADPNRPIETAPVAQAPQAPAATPAPRLAAPSAVNATLVTNVPGSAPRAEAPGQPRLHTVAGGDTLSKISTLYYGTPSRWSDILAANRDVLGESNSLIIGRTLRIP